jgi:phosphoglycerate dehydrogenase-like enzyme
MYVSFTYMPPKLPPPVVVFVGVFPPLGTSPSFDLLARLNKDGLLRLKVLEPSPDVMIPADTMNATAIVCRPTHGGHLSIERVRKPTSPLIVATLSKGTDHIRLPADYCRRIISAQGDANAEAVAELTMNLAVQGLRPVAAASASVGGGTYANPISECSFESTIRPRSCDS